MQICLNKYRDKKTGETFIPQYSFEPRTASYCHLDEAIECFESLGDKYYEYIETICFDTKKGTSEIIDIKDEVYRRRCVFKKMDEF